MGGSFMLEQPHTSLFVSHPAIEWLQLQPHFPATYQLASACALCEACRKPSWCAWNCEVYVFRWWMMHWGSGNAKRHVAISNNAAGQRFDRGTLTKEQRKEWGHGRSTSVKLPGHSSCGKRKFRGTAELKHTQPFPQLFIPCTCFAMFALWVFRGRTRYHLQ